ncbi:MAG: fibronectin type III domain-containing protein, partial [Chloroflexota bacterium]
SPVPRVFFAHAIVPAPRRAQPAAVQTDAPTAPQGVRASLIQPQAAVLTWRGADPGTSYRVYLRQVAPRQDAEARMVATVPAGDRYAEVHDLLPRSVYDVTVQACDWRGCGAHAAPTKLRTGDGTVPPPHPITVEATSSTEITVRWQHPFPGAIAHIEVSTRQGEPLGPPAEAPPGSSTYAFGSIRPQSTYRVRIQMCVEGNCSIHSPETEVTLPGSLTAADLRNLLPADPITVSYVEGIAEAATYDAPGGPIRAVFDQDRIQIQVDPADGERFLVLNEMYHPDWHAYAGPSELPILPTNTVMRGILVPPGVSQIELRFVPFFRTWAALGLAALGLLAAAAGALGLRLLDGWLTARNHILNQPGRLLPT